ncbi:MAG: TolC family protein [Myxococcota bacterium]
MLFRVLAVSTALTVVGCNYQKTTDIPPPVPVPESYSGGSETPIQVPAEPKSDVEQIRDARWWRDMGDSTLSQLIEEALRRNQSVRAGWARVSQSKFIANQVRAARMPQVVATGNATALKSIQAFGNVTAQSANGSLPVSYEVDLFARRARDHQGAKLDAVAARFDQDSLAISISAEVAEAWFDAINARIEVAVVGEQLETDLRFLELVELRYREGLNSAVDVHQQRQRVASQRALLAVSEAQIDLTDQRLSVLLGEAPGRSFPLDDRTLPIIGPTPDVRAPATLLEARPDLRAARTRVEAQDRRVAAAIGARMPQLVVDFTPSYDWLRSRISGDEIPDQGFQSVSGFNWSGSANINAPIFDGLLGRSQINQQRAIVQELVEQYAETIITAISEVEGALVLERQERLRIQYLEDEFRLATITLEATRDRYRAGLSDFLPVLTALQTRQVAELQLVASRRQLVSYRVQLYRALGGAWPEEFGEPTDG